MTRVLTDGFEFGGEVGDFTRLSNWEIDNGESVQAQNIVADAKSWGYGSYCLQLNAWAGVWATLWPSGTSELYMNWSWRLLSAGGYSPTVIRWRDTNHADVMYLQFTSNTNLNVVKATGATILKSITVDNAWASWAMRVKNTAGAFEVQLKINGTEVLNYSDATPVGAANLMRLALLGYDGNVYYDDIAINDTSGSVDNSWPGEISIKALAPNGNGDFNQWVGSDGNSTDNYLLVDEVGPSAADYVRTATANAEDWYNIASAPTLAAGDTLDKVFVHAFARRLTAGPQTVSAGLKIGGSTVWETPFTPLWLTYIHQHQTAARNLNPDTGLTWTTDNIRYLQIGFRMNS